jgi:hypothetical protein
MVNKKKKQSNSDRLHIRFWTNYCDSIDKSYKYTGRISVDDCDNNNNNNNSSNWITLSTTVCGVRVAEKNPNTNNESGLRRENHSHPLTRPFRETKEYGFLRHRCYGPSSRLLFALVIVHGNISASADLTFSQKKRILPKCFNY